MRNRSLILAAILTLAALTLTPSVALSQTVITDDNAVGKVYSGRGYGAVSTDILGIVKYVGPEECGDVAVAAGGDITFQDGACGAEAVDTAVECDAAIAAIGSRSGVFDLSTPHANCDTWGEVADLINASGSWIFIPVGVLRGDATDNVAITLSEIDATTKKGIALLKDSTTSLNFTIAMGPEGVDDDASWYATEKNPTSATRGFKLSTNPFKDSVYRLIDYATTVTTGGASTISVVCSKMTFSPTTYAWTESNDTIWSSAGGATTVEFLKTFPFLECEPGEKMLVRNTATTSLTAATAFAAGYSRVAK